MSDLCRHGELMGGCHRCDVDAETATLRARVVELEASFDACHNRLMAELAVSDDRQQEISRLTAEIVTIEAERDQLRLLPSRVEELERELSEARKEIVEINNRVAELAQERDEAREALRRHQEAVWWAMGLRGDFGPFDKPFGWRGELARRCGLSGADVNQEARKAAGIEEGGR